MDSVIFVVCVTVVFVLVFLPFQAKFWGKIFGIEYFEEKYTFQKSMTVEQIIDSFVSLRLNKYPKNLHFNIDFKTFYSIGHDGMDDWSTWRLLEHMPYKSFDDYDIRYKNAWVITIYSPDLHCTVYHGDSTLLYGGEIYPDIRLVGLGIIKFPWNVSKIKKEREFLKDIVSSLRELEKKRAN